MSLVFPTISTPNYPLKLSPENNSIKSTFEDGSVQARRKFTRSRQKWTLTWNSLPQSEFDTLDNFIRNQACFSANSFTWTNPIDSTTHEVYVSNYQDPQLSVINFWKVELELTEV